MDNTALFFQIFNLAHQSEILDQVMIFGAEYVIILTAFLNILLAFKGTIKEKKSFILILFGFPLAVLLIKIIHLFYNESRPFATLPINPLTNHSSDDSFPSRHATTMAVVTTAYFFYQSKWAFLFAVLTLWVGLSRIFVGVHYPLDILGGFATGFTAVLLVWLFKNWLKRTLS